MKLNLFGFAAMIFLSFSQLSLYAKKHSSRPVPFNQIDIDDSVWTPRLEAHAHHTLETCIGQIQDFTERINNFKKVTGIKEEITLLLYGCRASGISEFSEN